MRDFKERIRLNSIQSKEVMKYLRSYTVFSEEVILKLVRKMKILEQKIEEMKYG